MPTIDYKCTSCGKIIEVITTIEKPPKFCENCGSKMKKEFSPNKNLGIDFIGPGFYINDHGKHNWKKGKSDSEIADILNSNKSPY